MIVVRIVRTLGLLALSACIVAEAFNWAVLEPGRERARTASCQQNLKQLALAVRMYVQDFDERLPTASTYFEAAGLIEPYVKNWSLSFCPSRPSKGPETYSYGWNYRLAGKSKDSLGTLASEPMLFDREPWHSGKRNAIAFEGEPFMTSAPVTMRRLSREELRRYTYPSRRVSWRLRAAFGQGRWRRAERLYRQAIEEAGDNPAAAPGLYEELVAVQCKLRELNAVEATWREMKRKYPAHELTSAARRTIEEADRGVEPDLSRFEDRFLAMWRY